MGKIDVEPPNYYGFPIYGASFLPPNAIKSDSKTSKDDDADSGEVSADGSPPLVHSNNYVLLSGGGGQGNSGIPNALIISYFDSASNSLSDQPVAKLQTGDNLPYRMAVHPGGEGIICSFPKSCRWFEWDKVKEGDVHSVSIKSSERILSELEDIGQQLVLTFNDDGSLLAVGGEDGRLRVFKWPSMQNILDGAKSYSSIKDLDFSPDGKFLVSVGRGGPGRVWDMTSSTAVASLPKENGEDFGFCRFLQTTGNNLVLYVTVMRDQGSSIAKYNTTSWKRMSIKKIIRNPFSAFSTSPDGNLLAIGTIEGDILVVNSMSMRIRNMVKKSHLGLVTAMAFSRDSRALVSVSMDSSARVTLITDEKKNGMRLWILLLMILIAVAVYYAKTQGILLKLRPCCH